MIKFTLYPEKQLPDHPAPELSHLACFGMSHVSMSQLLDEMDRMGLVTFHLD